MAFTAPDLYSRVRTMLPQIFKFLVVGGLGTVIDVGGAAVLHSEYHFEPLAAKAVSITVATVLTYLGSRFWTFKERENQSVRREAVLFIVLNIAGLLIAEAVVGLVTYIMGLRGPLEYNAASLFGTGFGTIFRFWAYRKWVFLDPGKALSPTPLPDVPAFPDYPPWELDPAYLVPAEAAARAPLPAPSYSSPWQPEPAASRNYGPAPSSWGVPVPQPAPFPASNVPASKFPALGQPAPGRDVRRPAPPAPPARPAPPAPPARPAAPRSSGGGRHRKS
jgi:putative flippase GtrA